MKKLLFLLPLVLLLSGCWDRIEINDRLCVRAIGLDAGSEASLMRITFQVMQPQEENVDTAKPSYLAFTVEAPTFAKATDLLASQAEGKPHYEHLAVIFLGDRALESLDPAWLDYFYRAPLIRRSSQWAVVEGDAQALLTGPLASHGIGEYAEKIIRTFDTRGRSTALVSSMYQLFVHRANRETYGLLRFSYHKPDESDNLLIAQFFQVSGACVLGETGYLGTLNLEDWEIFRMLCGFQEGGILSLPAIGDHAGPYSFRLTESVSRLRLEEDHYTLHFSAGFALVEAVGQLENDFETAACQALEDDLTQRFQRLMTIQQTLGAELIGETRLARQKYGSCLCQQTCPVSSCLEKETLFQVKVHLEKQGHENLP